MVWFLFFTTPAAVATVTGVTGAAAVGQQEGLKTQNIIQVDYMQTRSPFEIVHLAYLQKKKIFFGVLYV